MTKKTTYSGKLLCLFLALPGLLAIELMYIVFKSLSLSFFGPLNLPVTAISPCSFKPVIGDLGCISIQILPYFANFLPYKNYSALGKTRLNLTKFFNLNIVALQEIVL